MRTLYLFTAWEMYLEEMLQLHQCSWDNWSFFWHNILFKFLSECPWMGVVSWFISICVFEGAKEVWRGCVNLSCEPEKVKRSVLKVIYSWCLKVYACRLIKSKHVTICPGNATINAATVLYSTVMCLCVKKHVSCYFLYGLCLIDCRFL